MSRQATQLRAKIISEVYTNLGLSEKDRIPGFMLYKTIEQISEVCEKYNYPHIDNIKKIVNIFGK